MTPQPKRRALGRGLDALLPADHQPHDEAEIRPLVPGRRELVRLPIEDVHPSAEQPRKHFDEAKLDELAQSIRAHGLIQPILVRQRPEVEGGGYWLIAGERRRRAAQRAGLHDVPALVREASPAHAFELALIENLQRDDLDPIEEAEAFRHLADEHGQTQEQIAERVGKDRATVANALRLLKLPGEVRSLVSEGKLGMGHARALLGLEEPDAIAVAARKVAARALSVRATEEMVRRERSPKPSEPKADSKSASVRDVEQRLTRELGARVALHDRGGNAGGRIEIQYANLDDLDRILARLLEPRS
jgi:ParB family transcriptional regulator, chromosome partitioning protein